LSNFVDVGATAGVGTLAPAHGGEISGLLESIVQRRFDFETDSALAIDKTCIDHKQQVQ